MNNTKFLFLSCLAHLDVSFCFEDDVTEKDSHLVGDGANKGVDVNMKESIYTSLPTNTSINQKCCCILFRVSFQHCTNRTTSV